MQNCEAFVKIPFKFLVAAPTPKQLLLIRLLRRGFSNYHPGLVEFCSYFDRWSSQSLLNEISFGSHFAGAGATEERSVHIRTCAHTAKI